MAGDDQRHHLVAHLPVGEGIGAVAGGEQQPEQVGVGSRTGGPSPGDQVGDGRVEGGHRRPQAAVAGGGHRQRQR